MKWLLLALLAAIGWHILRRVNPDSPRTMGSDEEYLEWLLRWREVAG